MPEAALASATLALLGVLLWPFPLTDEQHGACPTRATLSYNTAMRGRQKSR